MKKFIIYLLGSLLVSAILAYFTEILIPSMLLSTLYTVAGIVFSVGMSIAISPKTDEVSYIKMRIAIRRSYQHVRNTFIILFLADTILFVLTGILESGKAQNFANLLCLCFVILSVAYFVWNFIELQRFGSQIEDQVLKEKEQTK